MKRIRLDEDSFRILVKHGTYTEQGVTLNYQQMKDSGNFEKMIHGGVVEQFGAKIILADIGYPLIYQIIG